MTSMLAKHSWVLASGVALHLLGCECEDETALRPAVTTPAPAPAPEPAPRESLVHASRSGLPESVAAITIQLDGDHFALSNTALIATWPETDRTRVAAMRPEAASAQWPNVEREGTLPTTAGYDAPDVASALNLARDAELARSQSGAPGVFALRVTPETPWASVVRVMFASGQAGFTEPRFVLARGGGEVELRLPMPTMNDAELAAHPAPARLPEGLADRDPQEIANAIRAALEAHPPSGAVAPIAAPVVTLLVSDAGLSVQRDTQRLAAGCSRESIGQEPTIPTSQLNTESLTACLTNAGPSPRGYIITADGTLTFERVISVAEMVSITGRVAFGVTPEASPETH